MEKAHLEKIAEFVKLSVDEVHALEAKVASLEDKNASLTNELEERSDRFNGALKKAANALYDSDFICDTYEKKQFIKKSNEDPAYLAKVVEKICKAADVVNVGRVSRVKTAGATDDPVMQRAFGYDNNYNLLDE